MPYINDVLEQNKRTLEEQAAQENNRFVSRFRFDPDQVIQQLKNNILGQDEAIGSLSNLLYRIKADLTDDNKPLGVVFLLGPTGVGKTELVNLLSFYITGRKNALCRIDMNTLSQSHYAAALSGAPPGYTGSKENLTLFDNDALAGSYSIPGIVLFDEIEKASPEVTRTILNILDNGQLDLTSGTKRLNFTNSIIFMTSNLGGQDLLKKNPLALWRASRGEKLAKQQAFKQLQARFDPEFLNRIEQFLYFSPLEDNTLDSLIELENQRLNDRIARLNMSLSFTDSCRDQLKRTYNREFGARNIRHQIRIGIEPLVAHQALGSEGAPINLWVYHVNDEFLLSPKPN